MKLPTLIRSLMDSIGAGTSEPGNSVTLSRDDHARDWMFGKCACGTPMQADEAVCDACARSMARAAEVTT